MTSFENLKIKDVYRTGKDDLYNDFYKPLLEVSTSYDRAVGYFSSQLLSNSAKGLSRLIYSNGKMRLIIGHPLDESEFIAIKNGESLKEQCLELSERLIELLESEGKSSSTLELLALLIARNSLEIKFALRRVGMYHEKIGIFSDEFGNKVVFQGSANETPHGMGFALNAESISVYKSWDQDVFQRYGLEYTEGFERLWLNQEEHVITVDVPSQIYERIAANVKDSPLIFDSHSVKDFEDGLETKNINRELCVPRVPDYLGDKKFTLKNHQLAALGAWKASHYSGIFHLATGSGKTITAIYGAVRVYEARVAKNQGTCLIVAVPYIELAKQWLQNLSDFSIEAIQCFGSKNSWYQDLERQIQYFTAGHKKFLAIVVVNKTLGSDGFNSLISRISSNNILFVGDECHNHCSSRLCEKLPSASYKIGLSATPFRADDDEIDSPFSDGAKQRLIEYYGEIVATYSLSDAINDKVLTPYEYYIVPVYLTFIEQEKYEELSGRIAKLTQKNHTSGLSKDEKMSLTLLCGQRSRLLGSAENKLVELATLCEKVPSEERGFSLFYSGEGKPFSSEDVQNDIPVINQVSRILIDLGWKVSKFVSDISPTQRRQTMQAFKSEEIDALVAMKILDEGVDVPACRTAYILSSTKNPRQYVQRRGRILRRFEGKNLAKIYDFVVLPISDSVYSERLKSSEAERVNDFANLASNRYELEQAIDKYGLSPSVQQSYL
ncbi:helicase-related protein [Alkalimarinus alittae]|uniref:DEAD/DEAH box helicase family protein n=1 Tax=Alkalimarinus alittae TaxID=2961619 RepID=A0ABY6N478_9ALTE|nr:helicase-related protein [Alkalimarinus alittae]UZE96819.1 DEAD/DEAH box helicase family protein [Alkalimarinus alittae]